MSIWDHLMQLVDTASNYKEYSTHILNRPYKQQDEMFIF